MSTPLRSSHYIESLSKLIGAMAPDDMRSVHLRQIGKQVVLKGSVPTYDAKCKIEALALQAGIPIQNCLRVIPGARDFKAVPIAPLSDEPTVWP